MDTGADLSALHPPDGITLQCRFDLLHDDASYPVEGICSTHEYVNEPAMILFEGDDGTYQFDGDIDIAKPSPVTGQLPSILGRDVLNSLRIEYEYGT